MEMLLDVYRGMQRIRKEIDGAPDGTTHTKKVRFIEPGFPIEGASGFATILNALDKLERQRYIDYECVAEIIFLLSRQTEKAKWHEHETKQSLRHGRDDALNVLLFTLTFNVKAVKGIDVPWSQLIGDFLHEQGIEPELDFAKGRLKDDLYHKVLVRYTRLKEKDMRAVYNLYKWFTHRIEKTGDEQATTPALHLDQVTDEKFIDMLTRSYDTEEIDKARTYRDVFDLPSWKTLITPSKPKLQIVNPT